MPKTKRSRGLSIEKRLARGPVDLPFLMLTVLLIGIGLVMLLSASYPSAYYSEAVTNHDPYYYFKQQGIFVLVGLVAMYFVSRFDYQRWRGLSLLVFGVAVLLLIMVQIPGLGVEVNGALRWLQIPIPGFPQFQPSEVAKLAVILFFAARLSKRGERKRDPYDPRRLGGRSLNRLNNIGLLELFPYAGMLLLIIGLLALQRHMSATVLILLAAASILFAAGISFGWFAAGGIVMTGILALIIFTTDYMTRRIEIWLDPWIEPLDGGLQSIQSLLAIGSGGLLGLGLGNSRQKFLYLPEEHNDFIFAVVCEELGFVGAVGILALFGLLIIRGYWLAIHARDRFGSLLVVGIITLFGAQVFMNVGVVTGLFPVTGISLPFFSYGGSAMLIQMAEMGIVLAVSRQIPAHKEE